MTKRNIISISAAGLIKFPVEDITITFSESIEELLRLVQNGFAAARASITYKNDNGELISKEVSVIVLPKLDSETTVSIQVQDGTIGGILHTDISHK